MHRNLLITIIILLLVVPALLFAQDGKIRGKVTDRETGDPLIGANVVIDGTSLGASTDINGEYTILTVPPGTYAVKVSYIGYASVTISNVRVSSNITTTQDFLVSSTAIQVDAVEIVAERPLIQRNTTNTIRMTTQENIKNLPFRGLQNIVALNAGVVQQDGILYVRGGRSGEVAYFIDGATATNPLFNSEAISPIQEAIEEIQLQSGGYTAEFGGANSGIVRTTARTGGKTFQATVDYQTDDFAKMGSQFLDTSPRGYRNAVVTLGGPVPMMSAMRFFVAGQHNYLRNRNHMYLVPFRFDSLVTDGYDNRPIGTRLPGPVEFQENALPGNTRQENTLQTTLLWDANPVKVRFTGSYAQIVSPGGKSWPTALNSYFRKRNTESTTNNTFGSLRITHVLSPTTFYEVGLSYLDRSAKTIDPAFGDDWRLYVDSVEAFNRGYVTNGTTGWRSRFTGPTSYSVINAFSFTHENAPINSYSKSSQTNMGLTVDLTSQITSNWELKVGGRLDAWSMRSFYVGDIATLNTFLDGAGAKYDRAKLDADPALMREYKVYADRRGSMNNYGYDVFGDKLDDGPEGPRKPMFASAYFQNKFEFSDLVLNLGLRYEYLDVNNITVADYVSPDWDYALNYFKTDDMLVETDPFNMLLPRISFSFPVTEKTVFYAMYGKYAQFPDLNRLYDGNGYFASRISPVSRVGYTIASAPAGTGFLAKPERTTQYEAGFRQTVGDNAAFTISGFYKDIKDLLQIRRVTNALGVPIFAAYGNEDFATTKGIELTLELRRINRLMARLHYTLSDARGTGSNAMSSRVAVSDQSDVRFPNFIYQLDFNQGHVGTVMVDYRWAKGDGGPLVEGLGFNCLVTFNSGHNYTRILEPQNLGQASPWNIGVRPLIDARTRNPIEPVNSSSTPWVFNVDLNINKVFYFDDFNVELYVNVLNLFDTKQIINVFPNTGTAQDDAWLRSPLAASFLAIPGYAEFYKAINIDNRHAYIGATGNDLFGTPRQIRVGVKVEL